jgi:CDP-diglyceride synthetase
VGTALVALPALLAAFFLGPPWLTVAVVALALAVGLFEFFSLLRARRIRPMRLVGLVLAAALFLDVISPGWLGVPFAPSACCCSSRSRCGGGATSSP